MCKATGLTYSALATKARLSPSTINRFIRDDSLFELSMHTRDKISAVAGYKSYVDYIKKSTSPEVDFSLLKECLIIIADHATNYPNIGDIFDMAVDLYEIATEDRILGSTVISIGAAKSIIKNHTPSQ